MVCLFTANKGEMTCIITRYEVDYESFKICVTECVAKSRETLYVDPDPDDPHAIRFSSLFHFIGYSVSK